MASKSHDDEKSELRERIEERVGVTDLETIKDIVGLINELRNEDFFCGGSNSEPISERSIENNGSQSMNAIVRATEHEADVHFKTVWDSEFDKKVGVSSPKEASYVYKDVFEWEVTHHRWSTERTKNTDMWELDLNEVFYAGLIFMNEGYDVTFSTEVLEEFLAMKET